MQNRTIFEKGIIYMTLLEYQCVEKGSCDGSTAWLKIGGDV
jgi:hypothetical protein